MISLRPEVIKGWPPQGWEYYQPETNWWAPTPFQFNFQQQVANIIAMRKANPRFNLATDFDSVASDLADFTCRKVQNHANFCVDTDPDQKKNSFRPPTRLRGRVEAGVAAEAVGLDKSALLEWLGAGGTPVAPELAEKRAGICAVCPENSSSPACDQSRRTSWHEWFTEPLALALRGYLGIKHEMKLKTTLDEGLGKCLACRCELVLKVHTPLRHLLQNATTADLFDGNCWVLSERRVK